MKWSSDVFKVNFYFEILCNSQLTADSSVTRSLSSTAKVIQSKTLLNGRVVRMTMDMFVQKILWSLERMHPVNAEVSVEEKI